MNVLSALEQLAALDAAPIELDANRCVRARDRFSTCGACTRACPANALHVNGSVTLDAEACVACRQCVHVCPTGVFDRNDNATELLAFLPRLKDARIVELACARHPSPETGPPETEAVVRIEGCLASLGPSVYLTLLASGIERIVVRLDACAECPFGAAQPMIEQTLNTAQMISKACLETKRITRLTERPSKGRMRRPLYAKRTQVSRRDLFRRAIGEGQQHVARKLALDRPADRPDTPAEKSLPLERQRLLDALNRLLPVAALANAEAPLEGLSFARLLVGEKCTACGVCARICPTGALQLIIGEDDSYQLTFQASLCTGCGICLHLCEPGALRRESLTLAELIATQPSVLRSGTLRRCQKCGVKFAGESTAPLCPVCDFRRRNPFGMRLPPGFKPGAAPVSK